MIRDDYILRLIKQLADFVARIARRREEGKLEDALAESERAWSELFDIPHDLAMAVDMKTLVGMLGGPERLRSAARLLHEEGLVLAARRDPLTASLRYRRALQLFLEARAADPSEADEAAILELSRLVPASELDPAYRAG